jgi:mannose-6-phosphate isomerase-like protein (cupin superfamily)
MVGGRRHKLSAGNLLLIEKKQKHQIRNTGRTLLRTLNFYVPPAYRKDGNPLPRGKK